MPLVANHTCPSGATRPRRPWFVAGVVICTVLAAGCGEGPRPAPSAGAEPGAPAAQAAPGSVSTAAPPERDVWYSTYVLGAKVGWQHTRVRHVEHEGRPAVRTETAVHIVMRRGKSTVEMDIQMADVSAPGGGLLAFSSEIKQLGTSIASRGSVADGKLEIATTTRDKTSTASLPWKPEYGGPSAVEHSLTAQPMRPGEKRTIEALLPVFNQLGTVELVARQNEQVKLPGGTFELLRIESETRFPGGQTIRDVIWTDCTGQPLKMYSSAMDSELYAATRETAEDPQGLGQLDFNLDEAVDVHPSITQPHDTKLVRYRVTLARGNPAEAFPSGPSQQVKAIDAHAAEITVVALRPGEPVGSAVPADPPGDGDRQPNNLIQSDNPKIVALVREAVGDEKDPWQKALALERFVHGYVRAKNFSTAFASAAEVADTREGDCTEHAVLLAAVCRAAGIPARVAIGLVYHEGKFYYHMWDEVWVDQRWIGLDATLSRGGVGAAHLKLAHSDLKGSSAFAAFLPVVNVLGRGLKIEVLEQR